MSLDAALQKMRDDDVPQATMDAFARNYRMLESGDRGMLPESEIEPLDDVPDAGRFSDVDRQALERAVVIKLNGGLGTSMGMTRAKSLLEAKDGLTFLDIIVRQVLALRSAHDVRLPLVLMNSFYTREDTLKALERYPELTAGVPLDFVQGKVPKIDADTLEPASWPNDPSREWAPPGHGDLYASLVASGMLDALLDAGYEYAFIANSDNLGSVLEPRILTWFARERLPFAMEVADRTEADRKGGHPARLKGDGLVLRESAQTPQEDIKSLQDIKRHRYVNTNNLWVHLPTLADVQRKHGVLPLPMIVNRKTVDPTDASSPAVFQLESAMGAAVGVFDGAAAVHVPRGRFVPVKTTDDLLVLRSDAYLLTEDFRVELAPERSGRVPFVDLDKDHFKLLSDFDARFADGPPSLVECDRLSVVGDVAFGRDVVVRGTVRVEQDGPQQLRIADRTVLSG